MAHPTASPTTPGATEPSPTPAHITIDQVLSWGPCGGYATRDELLAITGGRDSIAPVDVLALDIPAPDRFWLLLRPEILGERELRLFACDCAEHVAHLWKAPVGSTWKPADAIAVARAFARGEATREELAAARAAARAAAWAAWDAAWAATGDAARAAARAAAWAAAGDAARAAARAAAWDAARAAAWDAAWDARDAGAAAWNARDAAGAAERKWQLDRLRDYLEGNTDG